MKRVAFGTLVGALVAVSVGCQQGGALSDQDKAAIQKQHEDYAQMMNAGTPAPDAVVKAYYAADATVLPPNAPATQDLALVAKMMTAPGGVAKNFKFDAVVVEGTGDLAVSNGAWEGDFVVPGGGMMHDKGKFLETWKKQADGSWKSAYDMWSSDMATGYTVQTGELKADASPELKNLAWFVGTWASEGEAKASPFGPAGKTTGTMECRWFVGGNGVLCKTQGAMPGGAAYHDFFMVGYNADAKTYTGYDVDNMGTFAPFTLAFKNNAWTINQELKADGKPMKIRMTMYDVTADSCSVKSEISTGGAWTVMAEAKSKRVVQ
jgi:ketosteroid isomerase-like protein